MKLFKLLSLTLILFGTSASGAGGDSMVQTDVFVIKLGKEAKIKPYDFKLSFLTVEEDSRCPKGVQCIHAGNGRIRVMAWNKRGDCAEFVLNTHHSPRAFEFLKYNIELTDLRPYPTAGDKQPRKYEAEFKITKVKE